MRLSTCSILAGLVSLLLPISALAQQSPDDAAGTAPPYVVSDAIRTAVTQAQQGQCADALPVLNASLDQPAIPDNVKSALLGGVVQCLLAAGDSDTAYRRTLDVTATSHFIGWPWRIRLLLELQRSNLPAAVDTIETISRNDITTLNNVPVEWLIDLSRALFRTDGSGPLQRRLYNVLLRNDYQPRAAVPVTDVFRRNYALLLARTGESEFALAVARQIQATPILIALSVEPGVRSVVAADFDARASLEQYLAMLRSRVSEFPDSLELQIEIASAERQLGRVSAALATLAAADPRAENAPNYADRDQRLNWWWDGVARAQAAANNYDAAIFAMGVGATVDESGGLNVSQAINLGETHLRFGRADRALASLAPFDRNSPPVSPYGEAAMRYVRGCAAALTGNTALAASDLAYLRAHANDNPQALVNVLLCQNDIDGAAVLYIARLDDPEKSGAALLELSDFDLQTAVSQQDPVASRLPALKARGDVQAAILRAGGIRRFNVAPPDQ